jgi:hypothetical protein
MGSVEHLATVSAPFLAVVAQPKDLAAAALGWQDAALVVRAVRGTKTRTLDRLFDEAAAAFQFPYYFGENWPAFRDCITDLDWLPVRPGVVVLIYQADQVLIADPAELRTFVQTLSSAAEQFGRAVNDGEWWDRPAVPFHVVLQGTRPEEFERWKTVGVDPRPLELS